LFIVILQLRHMLGGHPELYMFVIYSGFIWALWLVKVILSSRYRPYTGTFSGTTSVVVPVVDEPLDLFREVLGRMVEQRPGEIIVVINGAPNAGLVEVCEEFAPLVRWVHTPIPGKRNAVRVGAELSNGEITVLVDSDTIWTDGTLEELVKPFAESRVGGVTTRQRILDPRRSWITRWADWLENSRALYAMPAQSVLGQVGCLPGRTIAFRRSILMRVMDRFMTEKFMGVFLEVSDDRTLTNLTLKEGYSTVYQYTSLVYTDAPLQVKKLFKQQLRWARGSQYNTLRMFPWMAVHAPVLCFFFVMDIILPFLLAGVILGWIYRALTGRGQDLYEGFLAEFGLSTGLLYVLALMVASTVVSMAIRQMRHLSEKPTDFFRLPAFIIVSTCFLMPIRIIGFFRMAHASGWGTRAGAYGGSVDDPDAIELASSPAAVIDDASRRVTAMTATTMGVPTPVLGRATEGEAGTAVAVMERASTEVVRRRPRAPRKPRRRPNLYAGIPYLVGVTIFALQAVLVV
jgi:hyaluronan synthase